MYRGLSCLAISLTLLSGCVSKSAFEQKEAEVELARESLQQLENEYQQQAERNRQLLQDRTRLNRELTGLIEEKSTLQQDMIRARADRERAERLFEARNAEAGQALTELRTTVDTLTAENRRLAQQLESEQQARTAQVEEIKGTYEELVGLLEAEIERGEVTISELEGQLTVNMVEQILFASGKAEVKAGGLKVLRQVGDILKGVEDKQIRVEGHTDNVPISPRLQDVYPSNWDLAAARAINVVRFLEREVGIPAERLQATSFGEYRPVASNETPRGRAQNRRIQIVLVPPKEQ